MAASMEQFTDWLGRYFRAWKSNNASEVAGLFADDAIYYYGPYSEPSIGRDRIVAAWVADPDQQRDISTAFTPLAVTGSTGVAHWNVTFSPATRPDTQIELDGILVITFDNVGQCIEHKEWYQAREIRKTPQ